MAIYIHMLILTFPLYFQHFTLVVLIPYSITAVLNRKTGKTISLIILYA